MEQSSNIVRGALLMVLAGLCFAIMTALVRMGTEHLHPFQVVFFRNLFGLLLMLPWVARNGLAVLRTERVGLYSARAVLGLLTMLTWFWCLSVMPLAEAVSLSFTAPMFVTLGAALLLHEQVRGRRWLATLSGFVGALLILRPGGAGLSWPALAALASAATMAASILIIKVLVRTESPNSVVIYMVLMMTPLSLLPALTVWQWPTPATWGLMVLLGAMGTAGHMLFTRAVEAADASAIMPFDFVRLPFTAALGWLLFDQSVNAYTWAGGLVIFGSGIYIARREAALAVTGRRRASKASGPSSLGG